MGIYDRDYIRRDDARRSPLVGGANAIQRLRFFSVNTWIIIACVAVFVVDGFLPWQAVPMGPPILQPGLTRLPDTAQVVEDVMWARLVVREFPGGGELLEPIGRVPHPAYRAYQAVIDRPGGQVIGFVQVASMRPLQEWLHFSTARGFLGLEVWRLIGFQFLHGGMAHLLFNMLGLFFFGPLVERYLGGKRYLAFYLLCGIFGALAYLLLNLGGIVVEGVAGGEVAIPGLLFNDPYVPLVGASAGVYGVILAGAFLAPNATVLFWFLLPLRLKTFAYFMVGLAFLTVLLGGHNAGGEAGHLGGALAGWYFIRRPHHLHGFFDFLGGFDPTSKHYRGPKTGTRARPSDEDIDRILDKIRDSGLQSLTARERRILEASRDRDGR